ncbi:hypothetical protein BJAS_P4274 [Bathymodiolus japonicus methanotrophic gill symbiont]|uniref:AAA family ATPase n=1 Tax=Bathymodiolus japonicus methanotrophic gill symbiont TaxID=113269 RepID=UPI001B5045C2|nr:AAA family ATPase [Bathymodiolus japonicus methanotrophic gill symbiont]GFO73462.1 hypothetical protein BJAS_P4274 [Bathymodiolus japonicus methanotrophic gill symbiont]
MGKSLTDIARQLKESDKKVELVYAFNGTGKTRLSREFKRLAEEEITDEEQSELTKKNILYYSAFTEDLFYWDNDLDNNEVRKLKIHTNSFTKWVFEDQGQDQNVIANFQKYTDEKLTPHFNQDFSEVTFSFERGNEEQDGNIKISKGEESNFIWSVFYALLEQVIETLNINEEGDRDTEKFNQLKYVFIDDPVSSLDENHLIELAVNLAESIKLSKSDIRFVITTHNPLFYNVLHNECARIKHKNYIFKKLEDGEYELEAQPNDAPFSYHLYLKGKIEKAIDTGQIHKYHFNYLRNILEKMSTFLGYQQWGELLEPVGDDYNSYITRLINISSHSKHSGEEVIYLEENNKRVLGFLIKKIHELYRFK